LDLGLFFGFDDELGELWVEIGEGVGEEEGEGEGWGVEG
jgi:hypothetical protein